MVRLEKARRIVQGYGSLPVLKYGFGSASIRMRPRMAAIATASVRLSAPSLARIELTARAPARRTPRMRLSSTETPGITLPRGRVEPQRPKGGTGGGDPSPVGTPLRYQGPWLTISLRSKLLSGKNRARPIVVPQTLVTTKLRAPKTRPNLVARLRESLAAAEERKLTLVSTPAGFGKSTLLGEWAEDRSTLGRSVAWVSLEDSDDDPARFITYLVSALQTVERGIGEGILAALRSPESPPVEMVMGVLVNELADLPQKVSIVLDDYHLISSDTVHEAVAFLIEHMPENVHLVILSRTDPPLPLPKLRARDQVAEIRAADLRFTSDEAAAFLDDAMGLALSAGDVAALEEVTEGWAAALQLAALSMRDCKDVSGFVESFSGSNRHVLDFLADEVLVRQPEGVREFLLETSVLERMSAPLCDALTGRDDGQEMLERLERENLFVGPLDDDRVWYRYHHLFAD